MHIGFIGLGIMGSRMAANLLKHHVALTIFNRTPAKTAPLVEQGARPANTPADFANVDILFTMLAHPEAITAVALADDGFIHHLRPGALWVDCSTVTPSFSLSLAKTAEAHGVEFLDAPVAGSKPQAANGELTFFVGGTAENVETCRPYFNMMGNKVVHVGSSGAASALKVVINSLLGTAMASFAEALALGHSLGLPAELLLNVLVGGPVVPPFMAMKRLKIEQQQYESDFPLEWMHKDLHMAALAAYETAVPVPIIQSAKESYMQAMKDGLGALDFSAIYQLANR
ncbi:MAG: NAD(P)-dependent oxidoreductase [Anaerolineae bacterium]|nr:NAD(P)-dependent oxidoreductase [Anaerolineae bacterium]